MKKLLALLGAVGLTTIGTTTVIACGNQKKGKMVNITKFQKAAIFEAQGRHETIDQAKEAIWSISELPEGIENINVTTVNNNIKVIFIAREGYQTPNPLIIKFQSKTEDDKMELAQVISIKQLGTIDVEHSKTITHQQLLDTLKEKNSNLDLTGLTIKESLTNESRTATIKVSENSRYKDTENNGVQVNFIVNVLKIPDSRVELSLINMESFEPTNETTKEEIISALKVSSAELIELKNNDVDIEIKLADIENEGSIIIKASSDSNLVKGQKSLIIARLNKEISEKDIEEEIEKNKERTKGKFIKLEQAMRLFESTWKLEGTNIAMSIKNKNIDVYETNEVVPFSFNAAISVKQKYKFEENLPLTNGEYKTTIILEINKNNRLFW